MDPLLDSFALRYAALHSRSVELLENLPDADLFRQPRDRERTISIFSCGECLIRSAASVEQMCGGITTRLWDDPFEWTLAEQLSTVERVVDYLTDVEKKRVDTFRFFGSDDDLRKLIPAPHVQRTIFDILLGTLARAEHYQGRAFAIFQMVSDRSLPQI